MQGLHLDQLLQILLAQSDLSFVQRDTSRECWMSILMDKYLDPYLSLLDQFPHVRPAVLLLRDMKKKGTLLNSVFEEMENIDENFTTICHK